MSMTLQDLVDLVIKRFDTIDARLIAIEEGVRDTKQSVYEIQDEVGSINTAIENDAKRYFDHETRITRLEKVQA